MMLYRFWQFSRHAQIEQYLFSVPMILTTPEQPFPVAVRALPYIDQDLKSRNLDPCFDDPFFRLDNRIRLRVQTDYQEIQTRFLS